MEELFELISEGQALHPDPEDLSTDEEGEEGDAVILENFQPLEEGADFFRTEEDLQFLSPEGMTAHDSEGVVSIVNCTLLGRSTTYLGINH